MANGVFLFIDIDDPTGRKKATKPASQRYSKAARKHVMRDIGLARRKDKLGRPSIPHGEGQASNVVDGPAAKTPHVAKTTKAQRSCANMVDTNVTEIQPGHEFASVLPQLAEEDTENCLPMITRQVGCYRQDPFIRYPVEMNDRGRLLLDTFLDIRIQGLRAFRIAWYNIALLDDSTFNQVLSIAAIALGKLQKNPASTELEAIKYHSAALESVNKRLKDPIHGNSDGVVASVVGFACHSRQTADFDAWAMHMKALQKILDTRGGVDSVTMRNLRFLLFLIDTAGCCTRDIRPIFALPVHILPAVAELHSRCSARPQVEGLLSRLVKQYPSTKALSEIVRDLSVVTQYFEHESKTDSYFYQPSNKSGDWLVPLVHRCLDLVPNDSDVTGQAELTVSEALRHATILFMQPVRRRFGINTGSSEQRVRKLKKILQQPLAVWHGFEALLRWIIVSASTEARAIEERLWLAGLLASYGPFQDSSRDDHMRSLRSFIWKEDVFEDPVADFLSQVEDIQLSSPIWPPSKSALCLQTV